MYCIAWLKANYVEWFTKIEDFVHTFKKNINRSCFLADNSKILNYLEYPTFHFGYQTLCYSNILSQALEKENEENAYARALRHSGREIKGQ